MMLGTCRKLLLKYRFALTLAALFGLQTAIIGLFFLLIGLDMIPAQRDLYMQWINQRTPIIAALGVLLLMAMWAGLQMLVKAYLAPLARLAEDAVLLEQNPAHRISPQGAREVREVAAKLNALATTHQALHEDVQVKIDGAKRALAEEKNRLAALMSELALGVLVCNIEGRILLYNTCARQMLEAPHEDAKTAEPDSCGGSAAHGPYDSPGVVIGLGRSVFGVIERGLVVHALEQLQFQHCQLHKGGSSGQEAARPVSGFVTTLAHGQIMRAQMAPVEDEQHQVNGFVLTLEDITRNVELDSRRDALLQTLTQDSRAALASIRAAVETMQCFPTMSLDKRHQFATIIDDESQRLVQQIESTAAQYGDDPNKQRQLEDMRGSDLLALLLRRIHAPPLRATIDDIIDASLWLKVDSYALSQALAYLTQRLQRELGVGAVRFSLRRAAQFNALAQLDIGWEGAPLAAELLREWENAPMQFYATAQASTQEGQRPALSLAAVISRHGGEALFRIEYHSASPPDASRRLCCYRLLLPLSQPHSALLTPQHQPARPEFYDFDLFQQAGQSEELDQCLLSQLNYTVFDTETTGLQPAQGDEIISIGALRIVNCRLLQQESFDQLVQARSALSAASITIHGITAAMLEDQPRIEKVLPLFHRFAEDTVLVAHNAAFDMRFLQMQEERTGVRFTQPVLDTLLLSQVIHPHQEQHSLEAIAARLGVVVIGRHTALGDAIVTGEVLLKMLPLLAEKGILTLKDAREAARQTSYARIQY